MNRTAIQVILDEHASLSAVLRSILMMIAQGPGADRGRFFDVVRAMLFYIDEFPERRHHPKESDLLFPKLARAAPEIMPVIRRLEFDHMHGEGKVRELQHLLLGWELMGDRRRAAFAEAADTYVQFYLEHMRIEEHHLLPLAERVLQEDEWAELDTAFAADRDPLSHRSADPSFERLLSRIVLSAPAPIGVGEPV